MNEDSKKPLIVTLTGDPNDPLGFSLSKRTRTPSELSESTVDRSRELLCEQLSANVADRMRSARDIDVSGVFAAVLVDAILEVTLRFAENRVSALLKDRTEQDRQQALEGLNQDTSLDRRDTALRAKEGIALAKQGPEQAEPDGPSRERARSNTPGTQSDDERAVESPVQSERKSAPEGVGRREEVSTLEPDRQRLLKAMKDLVAPIAADQNHRERKNEDRER